MRPWFTVTIIAIIAGCLLSFWLVIDFALLNRVMFETPFTVTVRVPFVPSWSHRWVEVQFMYILTVSVLLGAGIVAFTTLIFDTKRALKVRSMRKELARLQKALEEAQAKLPPPSVAEKESEAVEQETVASDSEPSNQRESVTPEDIAHSFEDVVEQGDFLKVAQERVDDELERHAGRRPEGDIRATVTGVSEELPTASTPEEVSSGTTEAEIPADQVPDASVAAHTDQQEPENHATRYEDLMPPAANEEAQPADDAPKHDSEPEISGLDQEPNNGERGADEPRGNTRPATEEQIEEAVMEAEIVRDDVLSEEENGPSLLKKPPSESQSQGD